MPHLHGHHNYRTPKSAAAEPRASPREEQRRSSSPGWSLAKQRPPRSNGNARQTWEKAVLGQPISSFKAYRAYSDLRPRRAHSAREIWRWLHRARDRSTEGRGDVQRWTAHARASVRGLSAALVLPLPRCVRAVAQRAASGRRSRHRCPRPTAVWGRGSRWVPLGDAPRATPHDMGSHRVTGCGDEARPDRPTRANRVHGAPDAPKPTTPRAPPGG